MAERQDGEKPAAGGGDKTAPGNAETAATPTKAGSAKADTAKDAPKPDTKKPDDKTATSSASKAGAQGSANKGGGGKAVLWLIILLVLLGGGAYATKALWLPAAEPHLAGVPFLKDLLAGKPAETTPSQPSEFELLAERVAALEKSSKSAATDAQMAAMQAERQRLQSNVSAALQRIDELEKRISDVRNMAGSLASAGTGGSAQVDLGPLLSRIDALESSGAATRTEMQTLNARVSEGTASAASNDAKSRALVLAVGQLRDAALSGQPYADALKTFTALAGDSADLKAAARGLQAGAATGVPSETELRAAFGKIAGRVVTLAGAGGDGWLDKAASKVKTLATLRRTDGASADTVENTVAGIERKLADGDLKGAYDTASALRDGVNAEARTVLEGWLVTARVRVDAVRSLDALQSSAIAALGSGG